MLKFFKRPGMIGLLFEVPMLYVAYCYINAGMMYKIFSIALIFGTVTKLFLCFHTSYHTDNSKYVGARMILTVYELYILVMIIVILFN